MECRNPCEGKPPGFRLPPIPTTRHGTSLGLMGRPIPSMRTLVRLSIPGHDGTVISNIRPFLRATFQSEDSPILNDVTITFGLVSSLNGTYVSPLFNAGPGGGDLHHMRGMPQSPAGGEPQVSDPSRMTISRHGTSLGLTGRPNTFYRTLVRLSIQAMIVTVILNIRPFLRGRQSIL